jgi:hypothetical protein
MKATTGLNRDLSILIDESSIQATNTLTSDNTDVSNNDTVTVNGRVYTFKTALTGAADEVLRGSVDADTTLAALRTLINSGRAAVAAATVLTSSGVNVTAADTVTIGTKTYTFKAALTEATATAALTTDNTNPAVGDQVVIGTITYEFVSALETTDRFGHTHPLEVPNRVLIGADGDATLDNLILAVNKGTGEGTKYSYGTVQNSLVSAGNRSSHTSTMSARAGVGTAGNSIAKSENSSHLDWDGVGAVFTGGLAAVANEVVRGASAAVSLANLKAAINGASGSGTTYSSATVASTEVTAGAIDATTLAIAAATAGTAGNSLASTVSAATLSFTGAVLAGGVAVSAANADVTCSAVVAHVLTLTAVTAGAVGNALTLAVSSTGSHLARGAATFSGGGSTVGTSDEIGEDGKLGIIVSECPNFTGTPTYTVQIVDTNGKQVYVSGNLSENATTRTVVEQNVKATDKIIITTSTVVQETLPVLVRLR